MKTRQTNYVYSGSSTRTHGGLAYASVPERAPNRQPEPRLRPLPKVEKKPSVQLKPAAKFGFIFLISVLLVAGLIVVTRYAMIAKNNSEIERMEDKLAELKRIGEHLEVALAASEDLSLVMAEASDMGLGVPQEQQIVAISITDDGDEISAEQDEVDEERDLTAMLSKLLGFLH